MTSPVLAWVMSWICIQFFYKGQSYSFVNPYVTDGPRWISMESSTRDINCSASDLPMERSTLDASGPVRPSITRFTLSELTSLEGSFPRMTPLHDQDLPMERLTLDASGPQSPSIKPFTLCSLKTMECSIPWMAPISDQDLPMERFTLGACGHSIPFTIRFPIFKFFQLAFSTLWKTLVGIAPCTYSVYKAAHSFVLLADAVEAVNFSPRQVRAAHRSCKGFLLQYYPKARFCKDLFRFQQQVMFSGFASKSLNKLTHSLNGNYVCFEVCTPQFRSSLWKTSFSLPNGMVVFDYYFYGKNKLWLKYYRRGQSFELDTDRPTSHRLYGIMLRSIASRGGGPGSRWTYLQAYGRSWKICAQQGSDEGQGHKPPIYSMTDLHYDDPSGHDDIYNIDDSDDIYIMTDFPVSQTAPTNSVQGGYQDRRALRGTSRGYRSESSYLRRLSSRKTKQQEARRDFRQWKSRCKDSSLRTHGDQNPNPLICPKPAAQRRLLSQSRNFPQGYNQLRQVQKPVAVPVPTGFSLQLATWNVEGLREITKYDQIISLLNSKQIHLLAVQETKYESVNTLFYIWLGNSSLRSF